MARGQRPHGRRQGEVVLVHRSGFEVVVGEQAQEWAGRHSVAVSPGSRRVDCPHAAEDAATRDLCHRTGGRVDVGEHQVGLPAEHGLDPQRVR